MYVSLSGGEEEEEVLEDVITASPVGMGAEEEAMGEVAREEGEAAMEVAVDTITVVALTGGTEECI